MTIFWRRNFMIYRRIISRHSSFTFHILREVLVIEFCYTPESPLLATLGWTIGVIFHILWTTYIGALAIVDIFTILASFYSNFGGNVQAWEIILFVGNNRTIITLITDNNETVAHEFGIDIHLVKDKLIINVRGTIEDDIRNVFHLIGVAYYKRISIFTSIITSLLIDYVCHGEMTTFHVLWIDPYS